MSLFAIGLIAFAALCHALWNFVLKKSGGGIGFIALTQLTGTLLYMPIAIWFWHESQFDLGITHAAFMLGSGAIHVAYFLLLDRAYRRGGDLSLVYPVARATGPMLTIVIAILFLHEKPSAIAIAGAALIVIAAFLLGNPFGLAKDKTSLTTQHHNKSLALAIATGVLICGYTLWDRHAVAVLVMPVVLFYVGSVASRLLVLLPLVLLRDRVGVLHAWNNNKPSVIAIGVLSPLSYILVLLAMRNAPVSLVAPLREMSILFAAMLGAFFLKEKITKQRLFCSAMMLIGVVLIALNQRN